MARATLLVLRERKSRLGLILRLSNKRSDTVSTALIWLLRPFRSTYRSLTLDNGGEFAGHVTVASALGRPGSEYFARPYRASDRGSVEQRERHDPPLASQTNRFSSGFLAACRT